jgi:hypothetical protein
MFRVLKTGGKVVLSDIVTVGTMPDQLRTDMRLWAGCIAGAIDKEAYLTIVREAGFSDVRILTEKPYEFSTPLPFGVVSITMAATK